MVQLNLGNMRKPMWDYSITGLKAGCTAVYWFYLFSLGTFNIVPANSLLFRNSTTKGAVSY